MREGGMLEVEEMASPAPGMAHADWKESVDGVLESVDQQLVEHGLEVVMFDTGSDEYMWRIEPRQKT